MVQFADAISKVTVSKGTQLALRDSTKNLADTVGKLVLEADKRGAQIIEEKISGDKLAEALKGTKTLRVVLPEQKCYTKLGGMTKIPQEYKEKMLGIRRYKHELQISDAAAVERLRRIRASLPKEFEPKGFTPEVFKSKSTLDAQEVNLEEFNAFIKDMLKNNSKK